MAPSILPPLVVELKAKTTEFARGMAEARAEIAKTSSEGSSKFSQLATVGKAAMLGLGGAAIGLGTEALHLADNYEKSHARLTAAVTAAGKSYDSFKPQVADVSKAMEKLGFTNAQTEEALAHATIAMQDPSKAMKEMGLAADLARFKNVDLATATDVVNKAMAGNLKGLKSMGIDLPVAATNALKLKVAQENVGKAHDAVTALLAKHSDAMNASSKYHAQYEQAVLKVTDAQTKLSDAQHAGGDILQALTQRLGGQAAAHAETFAGKMETLKAKSEDLGKNIGLRLIPVIEMLTSKTLEVVQWLEKHKAIAITLAVVVGGALVIAIAAYTASMIAAAAATIAAMAPVLAIVAVVAAVGVAIYELATHWSQVWSDIKQWASDAWHFLEHVFAEGIKALIDPFMAFVGDLLHGAAAAFGWIPGIGGKLKAARDEFDQFQHSVNDSLNQIGKDPIKLTVDMTQFNAQMAAAGSQIRQLSPGGGQVLPTFSVGKGVKVMDIGGWVDAPDGAPVPAIIHGGEFVLSRDMLAGKVSVPASVAPSGSGGGDLHVTIPVVIDGREVGRATARYSQAELLKFKRNNVNAGLS